jgi:hypothetical protein
MNWSGVIVQRLHPGLRQLAQESCGCLVDRHRSPPLVAAWPGGTARSRESCRLPDATTDDYRQQ